MSKKGLLIIISGPSGAGKGTVVKNLIDNNDYCLSISVTTRAPRVNEREGIHYFFRSKKEFENMISNNELLEYEEFCSNYYGTPIKYVKEQMEKGKNVILEIEVNGANKVKNIFKDSVLIFLTPPNISELRKRLVNRGTEDDNIINMRMERAYKEFEEIKKYDYIVINNKVGVAVNDINTIVKAESMKAFRNLELKEMLKGDDVKC